MASYNELNALIDAYINRNGVQAITGQILNGVLKAMVEQLGRGYTIMGAAIPTTDPGTPDAPEAYFASTTGTYTNFGGIILQTAEFALLAYTPSEGWTKKTIYEGFSQVDATIDANVGTPQVIASYSNGVLSFDFRNLKGNTGDPAGFGTVAADVDANIGTPAVSVESSGPDTAKNMTFHFRNLKGETGVTSVVATVDNTTGNPSCAVSLVGQELHLDFTGLKGAQGNTGVSADFPITIANNLTTDDPTAALSAAQGVVLAGELSQLEHKVDELSYDVSRVFEYTVNLFDYNRITTGMVINSSGVETSNAGFVTSNYIRVPAGSYTFYDVSFVAVYNSSQVFQTRKDYTSSSYKGTYTMAADGYFRICCTTAKYKTAVVSATDEYPGDGIYVNNAIILKKNEFSSVIQYGGNMINRMTLKYGYIYSTTGELTENSGYCITDKIYVNGNTYYSFHKVFRITYFDEDGNYLATASPSNADQTKLMPYNTFYLILSLSNSASVGTDFQMVKGSSLPAYEPQYLIIDGYRLHDEPDAYSTLYDATVNWNKQVFDSSELFSLAAEVPGYNSATDGSTAAVYAFYDSLVTSYPDIVTKTSLGDDGNGTTIYKYDFDLANPFNTNQQKSKVFLISGIHPEIAGIFGLYHAMKTICEDSALCDLLENVHFIVLPVANPYGLDNGTRTDHNGVDLARNFTQDWEQGTPGSSTYGGATPLSEPAAQYIDAIMSANPDIVFVASCHSFVYQTIGNTNYMNQTMWGCGATKYFANISGKIINKLSKYWCDKYNFPFEFLGQAAVQAPAGSEGRQAARYGIQGGTFEVCNYFRLNSDAQCDSFVISRATEVYVNMIRSFMTCYSTADKRKV